MTEMYPGIYKAKIINYALSSNSKGGPQVEVLFEYNDESTAQVGGVYHQIRWWGQLGSEKAQGYTLKALDILGFKGKTNDDIMKLADGVEGGMLDIDKEVELVLEKKPENQYLSVKYINEPGRGATEGFKNAMTRVEAKVKLGALNLAGQLAMIRAQGPKPSAPAGKAPGATHINTPQGADDVPFDFDI